MLSKERKKELRRIYEEEIGKEYVMELENQPTYSPFEWVEYKSQGIKIPSRKLGNLREKDKPLQHLFTECL